MIAQVGSISANGDHTIGKLIAEAMRKVGKDGVITVEDSTTIDTTMEVVEGMQFDRGYLSPYFVTNAEIASPSWFVSKSMHATHAAVEEGIVPGGSKSA